jgi:hypothetical protein
MKILIVEGPEELVESCKIGPRKRVILLLLCQEMPGKLKLQTS